MKIKATIFSKLLSQAIKLSIKKGSNSEVFNITGEVLKSSLPIENVIETLTYFI